MSETQSEFGGNCYVPSLSRINSLHAPKPAGALNFNLDQLKVTSSLALWSMACTLTMAGVGLQREQPLNVDNLNKIGWSEPICINAGIISHRGRPVNRTVDFWRVLLDTCGREKSNKIMHRHARVYTSWQKPYRALTQHLIQLPEVPLLCSSAQED